MKTSPSHLKSRHVLVATAATLLMVACNRQSSEASRDQATARPQRASKESPASDFRTGAAAFDWRSGDTACFATEVGFTFGKSGGSAPLPDPAQGGFFIWGTYHLGVLSVESDTVTLAASFSNGIVLSGGARSPIFEDLVNSIPAVVTMGTDGSVRQVAFPADLPDEDRQILRGLYGWEFQARSGSASWESSETVANCHFQVTYTAHRDGSATKVRKSIPAADGPQQEITVSRFDGKAGRCWLDSLRGRELATMRWDGKAMGDALVSISIQRSAPVSRPGHFAALLHSGPQPGTFTEEPTAAADRNLSAAEQIRIEALRQKYQSVPYEVPFEALQKVANTGSHADALQALHDFRDLLKVRPELAPRVAESLKSSITPELSGLLAHALELANTEATQRTLADILTHPQDFPTTALAQAIVAAGGLGAIKDPRIPEALDSIQSRFESTPGDYPLDDAALFSLSRLSAANPEIQEPLAATLTPLLGGGDDRESCTALLALANARLVTPEIVDQAEGLLQSQTPQTRAAALSYFEQVPELSAGQTRAIGNLLTDADISVQLHAVAALSSAQQRSPGPDKLAPLKAITRNAAASADVKEAARAALEQTANTTAQR